MFATVLAIRDSKDNLIVRDDEVDGLGAAHVTADLPAGVYTVVGGGQRGFRELSSEQQVHGARRAGLLLCATRSI